jgi:hypothetical protein
MFAKKRPRSASEQTHLQEIQLAQALERITGLDLIYACAVKAHHDRNRVLHFFAVNPS